MAVTQEPLDSQPINEGSTLRISTEIENDSFTSQIEGERTFLSWLIIPLLSLCSCGRGDKMTDEEEAIHPFPHTLDSPQCITQPRARTPPAIEIKSPIGAEASGTVVCEPRVLFVVVSVDLKVDGTLTCSTPFKYAILFQELDDFWFTHDTIDEIHSEQSSVKYKVKGVARDIDFYQYSVEPRIVFYHNCGGNAMHAIDRIGNLDFRSKKMKLALLICVLISSCLADSDYEHTEYRDGTWNVGNCWIGACYDVKVDGTLTCSTPFKYAVLFEELDDFHFTNDRIDAIDTTFSDQLSVKYEVKGEAKDPEFLQDKVEPRIVFYHNCGGKRTCVCREWKDVGTRFHWTIDVNLETTKLERCDTCDRLDGFDFDKKK
ncbi:hypothetical protein PRIPAC_94436 [Pristionchus pacificus]|uniref:Uncharacterized protein n=1 Tax=Pristionchus pacificus TaxID=54126 RepID=A0A2A6BQ34_PRIPA|nr:hypothetical protein PRIPAC_94436 [Pristionchus pacificus]|eukprot:PDM68062.1 hypothetical protein PRIPAC_46106 [Pristionchus pacificus]